MAEEFVKNFGDALVTSWPLWDSNGKARDRYPSPNELKRRVIVKYKKLPAGKDEVAVNVERQEEDLASNVKNGDLKLRDKTDGKWVLHYFTLMKDRLTWCERPDDSHADDDDHDGDGGDGTADDCKGQDELHFGESWFHGKLNLGKGARARTEELMYDFIRGYVKPVALVQCCPQFVLGGTPSNAGVGPFG